ncbi:MAG: SH3 domain-containing protein, partial [Clostridiales Family XIII bacterium]|nr:SH3 domain-containing protein [Clostridiales Family XIII bacterium]
YSAVVSSDEGLRLRKGPGTDYDVLTLLSKGEKLSVLGISASSPDWTYVRYDTYEGWVASQYLTFSGTGTLLTDTD